jgi:hypothetical protein
MAKSSPLRDRIGSRFGGRGARKRTKIIVAALFVILAGSFATTLAANVTISGGTALEFGQGQVPAIACDEQITSAITEEWNNTSSNFHVKTITLSDVKLASASTADGGCGGETITVSLLDSLGARLTLGDGSPTTISFTVPTASATPTASPTTATVVVDGAANATTGSIAITLPGATSTLRATASAVARVVLETD